MNDRTVRVLVDDGGKHVPVQIDHEFSHPYHYSIRLSERVARLAYAEYARRYGTSQSFERLHERGGFGVTEVISLLADAVERLEGKK